MFVKSKIFLLLLTSFILLYSPFIVHAFLTGSIYSNLFFRFLEFFIGVKLCSLVNEIKNSHIENYMFYPWMVLLELFVLIVGVIVVVKQNIHKN